MSDYFQNKCPELFELQLWIESNMPDLHSKLLDMPLPDCRLILNNASGLNFDADDWIHDTCPKYLEALKRKIEAL